MSSRNVLAVSGDADRSKMRCNRWIFIPGIFGSNSGLRCTNEDQRADLLDLPDDTSSLAAARRIAEHLRLADSGPYVLVGNSYGALVVLHMARMLLDQCEGVVLVNPPLNVFAPRSIFIYIKAFLVSILNVVSLLVPNGVSRWVRIRDSASFTHVLAQCPDKFACHRKDVLRRLKSIHFVVPRALEILRTDLRLLMDNCEVPILLINSETAEDSKYDCFPLGGGTHFGLLLKWEECLSAIDKWLDNMPARQAVGTETSTVVKRRRNPKSGGWMYDSG